MKAFFVERNKDSFLKLHRSQRLNYAIIYKYFTILKNYKWILDKNSETDFWDNACIKNSI